MKSQRRQSAPHRRTRADHKTETAEDYVEATAQIIAQKGTCRITDLAARFSVSSVTVHRIVARLQVEGLVDTQPYKPVTLTASGRRLAARCRRRHEIVVRFLRALGVDEQTAEIDAEGIEHHVSPVTLRCFEEFAESRES